MYFLVKSMLKFVFDRVNWMNEKDVILKSYST